MNWIITLLIGIILGMVWTWFNVWFCLRTVKKNCLGCNQPKPLKEIFVFCWKTWTLANKLCQACRDQTVIQF